MDVSAVLVNNAPLSDITQDTECKRVMYAKRFAQLRDNKQVDSFVNRDMHFNYDIIATDCDTESGDNDCGTRPVLSPSDSDTYVDIGSSDSNDTYVNIGSSESNDTYVDIGTPDSNDTYVNIGSSESNDTYVNIGCSDTEYENDADDENEIDAFRKMTLNGLSGLQISQRNQATEEDYMYIWDTFDCRPEASAWDCRGLDRYHLLQYVSSVMQFGKAQSF